MIATVLIIVFLSLLLILFSANFSNHLKINENKLIFDKQKQTNNIAILFIYIFVMIIESVIGIVFHTNIFIISILLIANSILFFISQIDYRQKIIPNILCLILFIICCLNLFFIHNYLNYLISLGIISFLVALLYILERKNIVDIGYGDLKLLLSLSIIIDYRLILPFLFISFIPMIIFRKEMPLAPNIFIAFSIVKKLEIVFLTM